MEAQYIECYDKLSSMKPGDIAVSRDRESIFICGHHYNKLKKDDEKVILNLNKLYDQYSDSWNLDQPIRKLKKGDVFEIRV